jgi:glutamine synthetase
MEPREIKRIISESAVQYLLLQFTDILGQLKGVEVGKGRLDEVLANPLAIDASAMSGPFRDVEADGRLKPDMNTFALLPNLDQKPRGARLIADLTLPDGSPSESCPRRILRCVNQKLLDIGISLRFSSEVEFYIFPMDHEGNADLDTADASGYLDFSAGEPGQDFRREVIGCLEQMGLQIHHAHHEISPGQHEIGLTALPALECADAIVTLRFVTKAIAKRHGFIATFMPKPIFGSAGSGMHISISATKGDQDAFSDAHGELSTLATRFMAGILSHGEGLCLLFNPLVNSYKRLVPGHEAPTHIYWSKRNTEPFIRVPDHGSEPAAMEVRGPDPSCNPYLSIAALIAAGFHGIDEKLDPWESVEKDIYKLSGREMGRLRIKKLPANLGEAVWEFEKDKVLADQLGKVISKTLARAKAEEWRSYIQQVHPWELDRYLAKT